MADDDDRSNLPARVAPQERSPARPGDPGGVTGSLRSGFISKLRARAFGRYADEYDNANRALKAKTEVYRSAKELERAIGEFQDVDNIVDQDQTARDNERTEAQHKRDARERERARERAEWDALDKIAAHKNQMKIEQAGFEQEVARTGREISAENIPVRKQRAHEMYKTGALNDQLARQIVENQVESHSAPQAPTQPQQTVDDGLRSAIKVILDQIEKERARGAAPEILSALYDALARLNAEQGK